MLKPYMIIIFLLEFITISMGVYYWRKLDDGYKLLSIQVFITLITEMTSIILSRLGYGNNAWLFNIYIFLEVWLLGGACIFFLKNRLISKFIGGVLPLITLFGVIRMYMYGVSVFNNWLLVSTAIFYIISFTVVLIDNAVFSMEKVYTQPLFLIAIAIIIYYATIIPLFGLLNYLVAKDIKMADKLYSINQTAATLRYALMAIAFYIYTRQTKKTYTTE